MASSNRIPSQAAAWASSVLLTADPQKYSSIEDTKEILETRGLQPLRKDDLKALWNNLKRQSFVCNNPQGIRASAKKDDLVQQLSRLLLMPEASQLAPIPPNVGATTASHPTAAPTVASPYAAPAAAAATAAGYPAVASRPANANASVFDRPAAPYAFAGLQGSLGSRAAHLPGYIDPMVFGNPVDVHWSPYTAAQNGQTPQTANSDASRKRKAQAPPSLNPGTASNPHDDALAAAIAGAFDPSATTSVPAPAQSVEERIWSELKAGMGFKEEHKDECFDAIRRAMKKSSQPTADEVMLDIINQRQEAEEAHKMDLARLASEQDRNEESERLREQRKQDEEGLVLSASLDEWKNPLAENKKIMFKSSWLLRHEQCTPLLKDIVDSVEHRDTKKILIQFLSQEKNAHRWYDEKCGSKYYFTCVAGKRMLDALTEGGSQRLKTELESLTTEVLSAMSLPSMQNEQNIPHIFVEAKEEHHVPSDEDEDEDDGIIVLDEAEVRRTQESRQRLEPSAATLIEMT